MKGFTPWLLQRLSAVYMLLLIPIALFILLNGMPWHYEKWTILFNNIWIQFSLLVFFWALLFHAWVGLRDVIIDYVHPILIRLGLLSVIALFLFIHAIWIVKILWL
jgi:succinate dehydrogenase / fumarate reductase membrane anchor subunit